MPRETPPPDIADAPRFYPLDAPRAPQFHPEFGYLLPSPLLRRRLRQAAVAALVGSAIAATTALALIPRPSIDSAGPEEPIIAVVAQPVAPVAAEPSPAVPAPGIHAPPRVQGACDELSTAFLAPDCRSGRIGKARLAHARAGHKLSTITIGRADRRPEGDEPAASAAAPAPADAAPGAPKPPPTAIPAKPKPPVRTVRKERPSQEAAAAEAGMWRGNPGGLASPRSVLPSLFGGTDWARSW